MARPPDDEDDPYAELVDQVKEALASLDLESGELAEAVVDSLRSTLHAVAEALPGQRMTVLDGGEQASDQPRPDLHLAHEQPRVRVVKTERPRVHVQESPLHLEGALRVDPAEEEWQTLFRGADARTYRIACDTGAFEVALDGQPADRVGSGRSMDVEARLIRVRAATTDVATGRYARIA